MKIPQRIAMPREGIKILKDRMNELFLEIKNPEKAYWKEANEKLFNINMKIYNDIMEDIKYDNHRRFN